MDGETGHALTNWRFVTINGQIHETNDQVQDGRDLLALAGLEPASEHQLVMVRKNRTRLIGLDDKVDLKDEKGAVFRAWPGDRVFAWTLDEIGQVWGDESLQVDELIALFDIDEDKELVLERDDEPDVVLQPGGVISLAGSGVEDVVTRRKRPEFVLVTIFTTAGVFPAQGALRVRSETMVSEVLDRAAHKLGLQDTETWVVTFASRDINPNQTFAQNALSGTVELDWGPREGGGGEHA